MSVAELSAADTLATVKAGSFPRGAVGARGTGSGIDSGKAPATFTGSTSGIGQTQMDTSAVFVGAAVGSWRTWVKDD